MEIIGNLGQILTSGYPLENSKIAARASHNQILKHHLTFS